MPLQVPIEKHCSLVIQFGKAQQHNLYQAAKFLMGLKHPPCFFINYCDVVLRTTPRVEIELRHFLKESLYWEE